MATPALLLLVLLPCHQAGLFPVRMPLVTPTLSEVYLCTQVFIGQDTPYWLTGFTPVYSPDMVHHMVHCGAGVAD